MTERELQDLWVKAAQNQLTEVDTEAIRTHAKEQLEALSALYDNPAWKSFAEAQTAQHDAAVSRLKTAKDAWAAANAQGAASALRDVLDWPKKHAEYLRGLLTDEE